MALRRLEAWLHIGVALTENALAVYLGSLFEAGRSPATASMIVAAMRAQYRLIGEPSPIGKAMGLVIAGFRRTGATVCLALGRIERPDMPLQRDPAPACLLDAEGLPEAKWPEQEAGRDSAVSFRRGSVATRYSAG